MHDSPPSSRRASGYAPATRSLRNHALDLVRTAVARYLRLPLESVRPDMRVYADLGLDGFDLAFIAAGLEEETCVEAPFGALEDVTTIDDLGAWLEGALSDRPTLDAIAT